MEKNSKLILAGIAVCLVALAVVLYYEMQWEPVDDTGEMIDTGTVFIYDAEMTMDGETKKGEIRMTILGFNPTGMLYDMEIDESLGTGNTGGIVLSNDMSSGSERKVIVEPRWEKLDTNFGKKRLAYTKYVEDGMTTESWFDQYTGIEYKEAVTSDAYSMTMVLKSMDVKWQPFKEEIEPSDNLGSTLNYDIFYMGEVIGYDQTTVVTNPDKDGIYYTREIMYIEGEGVVSMTYNSSGQGSDPGSAEPTGETVVVETIDGTKALTEIAMEVEGSTMYIYIDEETGFPYRMVIDAMGMELVLDYKGETVEKFWEEDEE